MNKKYLPFVIGAIVLMLLSGGVFVFMRSRPPKLTEETPTTKKRIADDLNKIAVDQRPYITLKPEADGRNITLSLMELKKPADSAEYELEYQSGTLLQGAFGALELGSLPSVTKIFLGSCSAGGKCSYHEDIKGGSLLTRYDGSERYALKSDWRYYDNVGKVSEFSSKDAKFQLSSDDMKAQRYVIVFATSGYPGVAPGSLMSDVFSLQASSPLAGVGTLSIRANETGNLKIAGWDGSVWKTFDSQVEDKTVTAEVELMEAYVVVQ